MITCNRCKIGYKFVLFTSSKSQTGLQLIPTSVIICGAMAIITHYFMIRQRLESAVWNSLKLASYCLWRICSWKSLVFGNVFFIWDNVHYLCSSWASCKIWHYNLQVTGYKFHECCHLQDLWVEGGNWSWHDG